MSIPSAIKKTKAFSLVSLLALSSVCQVAKAEKLLTSDSNDIMKTDGDVLRVATFREIFNLPSLESTLSFSVAITDNNVPVSVLWPEEEAEITVQIKNLTAKRIKTRARMELIHYGTRGVGKGRWVPEFFKFADLSSQEVKLNVAANGHTTFEFTPKIPETKGAYALVVDLGEPWGRAFVGSFVRTFPAKPGKIRDTQHSLDYTDNPQLLSRLGVKASRGKIPYFPTTEPGFDEFLEKYDKHFKEMAEHDVVCTLMVLRSNNEKLTNISGRLRKHLDENDVELKTKKGDAAWHPKWDKDFEKFCKIIASRYGYPKGPVTGVKLWNEPWESRSISNWGADMLRFRELYTHMAQGITQANKTAGVDVYIGGADSFSNTIDKLFPDGDDRFLKWFDFTSIHYSGLTSPRSYRPFLEREHRDGRVQIFDTESWWSNMDERVAGILAATLAAGYDRNLGARIVNVGTQMKKTEYLPGGKEKSIVQRDAWSVASAIGAFRHFVAEKRFNEIVLKKGLPWIFEFQSPENPHDACWVVVGDIEDSLRARNEGQTPFRTVRGQKEIEAKGAIREKLQNKSELDDDAFSGLLAELSAYHALSGEMSFQAAEGVHFHDLYGNRLSPQRDGYTIALDNRSYFVSTDGTPQSYDRARSLLKAVRLKGVEPLETIAYDLTQPIEEKPVMRLKLTNILSSTLNGKLALSLGDLEIDYAEELSFAPYETKHVPVKVIKGAANEENEYPLSLKFTTSRHGTAVHHETIRANYITRKSITVDGDLSDWEGSLPQTIKTVGSTGMTGVEAAWLPFLDTGENATAEGNATAYLAYDEAHFYFGCAIEDNSKDAGTLRFETRDDDMFFYPETSYRKARNGKLRKITWPKGVRKFTYRRPHVLPSGIGNVGLAEKNTGYDNVQIAFNAIPLGEDDFLAYLPGTMPGYGTYSCSDYEFALNRVSEDFGGGTEIWPLLKPGMPLKHFFPRQPKAPGEGPVKEGQLAVVYRDGKRYVECALPWSAIPHVKAQIDRGEKIKFSYRVNHSTPAPTMELAKERSVSRQSYFAFSPDWKEHWANELEFGVER